MNTDFSEKSIKSLARQTVKQNLVLHIAAFLCPWVCLFSILYALSAIMTILGSLLADSALLWVYPALGFVTMLIAIAFSVPLFYGFFVFEKNTVFDVMRGSEKKPEADFLDLFTAFSCFSLYKRSIHLAWSILWRFFVYYFPVFCLFYAFVLYNGGMLFQFKPFFFFRFDMIYLVFSIVIIAAIILCTALFARVFSAGYLCVCRTDLKVSMCFRLSALLNSYEDRTYLYGRMVLSFIPLTLVSFLTFGVLFIVYTLPYFFLVGFFYADEFMYVVRVRSEPVIITDTQETL